MAEQSDITRLCRTSMTFAIPGSVIRQLCGLSDKTETWTLEHVSVINAGTNKGGLGIAVRYDFEPED